MNGQQVTIPLNSPVDAGTYDIIQNENSFKKKNSIVYKGTLANLRTTTGTGFLSTTGKNIQVTDSGIKAGDVTFPFPSELNVATDYQNIDSYKDVLFARVTETGLAYIRRPSATTLRIHTPEAEFDLINNDKVILTVDGNKYEALPYSINGFITQNRDFGFLNPNLILVTKHYYASEIKHYYNKYSIYTTAGQLLHTWEDSFYGSDNLMTTGSAEMILGDKLTGYVRTEEINDYIYNYIYWGFDDNDMQKRFIVRTYYYWDKKANGHPIYDIDAEDDTNPNQRHLFIDDNPSDLRQTYSSDGFIYSGRQSVNFKDERQTWWGVYPVIWGMGLISDKGYVYGEPLIERTPINQEDIRRPRGLWNSSFRTLDNGVLVTEVPLTSKKYWNGSAYATEAITRYEMNSGLGPNPTTYASGSQNGLANWSTVKFTRYVDSDDETSTGYNYNWILSINLNTEESYQTISAIDDNSKLPGNIAHITFFNFSDPFGSFSSSPLDSVQVFPHMRFFMNVQQDRGKYWDYGKGWNCMTVDQIYVNRYTSYGVALWETPLSIVYNTVENNYSDNLNFTNHDFDDKLSRSLDVIRSETRVNGNAESGYTLSTKLPRVTNNATNYPTNSDNKFIRETEFQVFFTNTLVSTEYETWHQMFRLHPITSNMISDSVSFYSNHSWTGWGDDSALNVLTHSYKLDDNLYLGVYQDIPTALSVYNTLLFTPQDLGDNYSFDSNNGNFYITRYSTDSIESIKIIHNAEASEVSVAKIADYEFRTNILGARNLIVEDHNGNFSTQHAFYPYIMDTTMNNYFDIALPGDSTSSASNGVWYFAAGSNFRLNGDISETSTFLLPPLTLNCYVATDDVDKFNKYALDERNGKLRADMWCFINEDELDEFWTFNRATTDLLYKNTKFIDAAGVYGDKFITEYANTSWWAEEVVIYPVGIISKISGENYTTPTVDAGNNYSARFYRNSNKTFLVFNQNDLVYFGDRIFTIMSGNYYFDGQGIYYLGSRDDYSQNIFTAYAIGMKFLANSSAEAYFYSEWDKCLYLYTASNTLQKADSLADMGKIIDSLYSSSEQALYILFDDGKLLVKPQNDSMIIENIAGTKLQSTAYGCEILGDNTYECYNPQYWENIYPIEVETEWLGDQNRYMQYSYVDVILLDETGTSHPSLDVEVDTIDGADVAEAIRHFDIKTEDWRNHLARIRIVPEEQKGNAIKIKVKSTDEIKIFSISGRVITISDVPQGPRNLRG